MGKGTEQNFVSKLFSVLIKSNVWSSSKIICIWVGVWIANGQLASSDPVIDYWEKKHWNWIIITTN